MKAVIFPPDQEAAAVAYAAWRDDPARNPFHPDPLSYVAQDRHGNWVTPYLGGVIWDGAPLAETPDGEALRAAGMLAETVEWTPPAEAAP